MGIDNSGDVKFAKGAEDGCHMTVRAGALDEEGVRQGQAGRGHSAGKRGAKRIDLSGTEMRNVGDGAGSDPAVFTIGFAEEDGRGRVTVRNLRDIHDYIVSLQIIINKNKIL
jgi:hypothetical protein